MYRYDRDRSEMKVRDEERMVGGGEAVGGVTKRERERNVRGGGWVGAGWLVKSTFRVIC